MKSRTRKTLEELTSLSIKQTIRTAMQAHRLLTLGTRIEQLERTIADHDARIKDLIVAGVHSPAETQETIRADSETQKGPEVPEKPTSRQSDGNSSGIPPDFTLEKQLDRLNALTGGEWTAQERIDVPKEDRIKGTYRLTRRGWTHHLFTFHPFDLLDALIDAASMAAQRANEADSESRYEDGPEPDESVARPLAVFADPLGDPRFVGYHLPGMQHSGRLTASQAETVARKFAEVADSIRTWERIKQHRSRIAKQEMDEPS